MTIGMTCMRNARGQFVDGPDPDRHQFTPDECSRGGSQPTCHRLTLEHRRQGGRAAWLKQMAELRLAMNLNLPSEQLREIASRLQGGKFARKESRGRHE